MKSESWMRVSQKKKIRGWKRRVRKIHRWREAAQSLDLEHLAQYERDYVKLWIHPFYGPAGRTPPLWYRCLLLEALVDVYHHWRHWFQSAGEPYYLKIWLFDPDFMCSQVVAAWRNALHFYDKTFVPVSETKPFPYRQDGWTCPRLDSFDWSFYMRMMSFIG